MWNKNLNKLFELSPTIEHAERKPLRALITVVAGVIGVKKFASDLWGDTVNTASRMESHGEAGKINVTEDVQQLLNDTFEFKKRALIEIKGKGMMQTYFLLK